MVDEELKRYIEQNIQTQPKAAIRKKLIESRWPEREIDEAFLELSKKDLSNKKASVLAIISLITAFLIPVLGIVLGVIALIRINNNKNLKGKNLAIAAIILSCLMVIVYSLSLIALSMFFSFLNKPIVTIKPDLENYAKPAALELALTECEELCRRANDTTTIMDFCSRIYKVDWNKDGIIRGAAQYGNWWFCEEKIPCFVLVSDCKGIYDGNYCRDILAQYAKHKYYPLYLDSNEELPSNSSDYSDGCDLPDSATNDPINGLYATEYNWKERFCFSSSYYDVLIHNFKCQNISIS
ncbi:DUF4190 domain-containing protein [Candidatus Woesearchaeota archaeon]|nr:DUF4190 domain-containing protein [Candidatus Woesearchaeota archaeon]